LYSAILQNDETSNVLVSLMSG